MQILIIQNNISQALDYYSKNKNLISQAYYIIDNYSDGMRKKQYFMDFDFLSRIITKIQSVNIEEFNKKIDSFHHEELIFFGWDSEYEQNLISKLNAKQMPQNRLLNQFHFETINGFTPFRKSVEKILPNRIVDNVYQADDDDVDKELSYYFRETHLAKDYFNTRNGVVGRDYSTKLSAFLSSGRLNVRYLYNYIKDYENEYGGNKSTYWIQFEILWREFFYWSYQKNQKKLFSKNGLKSEINFKNNDKLKYQEIQSGVLFQDDYFMQAVCRELEQTGFVSNRLRQVFASTWIHKYQLDWRLGAYYFEKYLKDFDVYSNWGNWQYLAGVGHDPRGSRVFNVIKQIDSYDREFQHISKWLKIDDKKEIRANLESQHKMK